MTCPGICRRAASGRDSEGVLRLSPVVRMQELQAEGLGPRAMARRLGLDRQTGAQDLAPDACSPPPPVVRPDQPALLDPDPSVIPQGRDGDRQVFHPQRHTAPRIDERLPAESPALPGAYSTVPRSGTSLRTSAPSPGPLARVWHPGEGPGDGGTAEAVVDGVPQTCQDLTVSVPDRHAGSLPWFGGAPAACRITGLQALCPRIRGVPPRRVLDTGAGMGKQGAQAIRRTELLGRCPAPDGFRVTLCTPSAGHEQGPGEHQGGYHRRHRRVPPAVTDGARDHAALLARSAVDGARPHDQKGVPLATLLATDPPTRRPLPRAPCDPGRSETVRTDATGTCAGDGRPCSSAAPESAQPSLTVRMGA
jgi:hypothetical protein